MLKRKNAKHFGLSHPTGVGSSLEVVTSAEQLEDGNVINRVSLQDVSLAEVDDRLSVINPDEYTLENLMKAGVSLDQINLSSFVAPTDKATIAERAEKISLNAFDNLIGEETKASIKEAKNALNNVKAQTEQKVNENAE